MCGSLGEKPQSLECKCVRVCVSVPLLGSVWSGQVGGNQLLYIHGERLGGDVLSLPWQDRKGQVRGSSVGACWSVWLKLIGQDGVVSSREGCIFLSPPMGCSSSAPGSKTDPLGHHLLSTLPNFERRQKETRDFFKFHWDFITTVCPLSISSFPYKARQRGRI